MYLVNGNMLPIKTIIERNDKSENEEVLELENNTGEESGNNGGENSVSQRHNSRGKLV